MKLTETYEEVVDKKPADKIRPIDKNILRMYFVGAKIKDIAKETKYSREFIREALDNPVVQKEIRRLDRLVEKRLVRAAIASKTKILEASVTAAQLLVDMMKRPYLIKERASAAVKVLEYTHGKPRIPIDAKISEENLSENDLKEMQEGLEEIENEGE